MRIQHNISALNAHRQLGTNNTAVSKNLEKLSSGYRINRAADDAAGLAISEKMRGQIRGLNQAQSNAQDGISLIQTAEGGLNETHSILQRMRELAVQNSNGTYQDTEDRANANKEFVALQDEIDRIGNSTKFNKISLLTGTTGASNAANDKTAALTDPIKVGDKFTFDFTSGTALTGTQTVTIAGKQFKAKAGGSAADEINITDADTLEKQLAAITTKLNADTNFNAKYTVTSTATGITFEAKAEVGAGHGLDAAASGDLKSAKPTRVDKATKAKAVDTGAGGTAAKFVLNLTGVTGATTSSKAKLGSLTATGNSAGTNASDAITALKTTYDALTGTNKKITIDGLDYTAEFDAGASTITLTSATKGPSAVTEAKIAGALMLDGATAFTDATKVAKTDGKADDAAGGGSASISFRIGANADAAESVSLALQDMRAAALGVDATVIDVTTEGKATTAITEIDKAINNVSGFRADLGALQNRLEHTVANLGTTSENLTAAESRIRDVDMAKEMMEMTKNNILTQAAQSMLAQANTQPQGVLQLLR